jgi:hypothetical protein
MTTTWNPADKHADVVLSGGNLIATIGGVSNWYNARSTSDGAKSTGKWYYEITLTAGVECFIGIGTSSQSLALGAYLGGSAESWGYYSGSGAVYHSGGTSGARSTWTTGDVIGVAYDGTADTVSFYKNGVLEGAAETGVTGTFYPMVSLFNGASVTANFGASTWAYDPPSGYAGYEAGPPTPGIAAATMESLTASGARIAAGAVTISALTAVGGMNGFGSCTIEALTVSSSGGHNGGECTLPSLTIASTGRQENFARPSMTVMTMAATGFDSPIYNGAATLRKLRAAGTGSEASVGSAAVSFEVLTAEGHVAPAGAASFESLTSTSTGVTGQLGTGASRSAVLTASGTGTTPIISLGAASFNKLVAQGAGSTVVVGTGAVTFQQLQVDATGFGGSVATAAIDMALMTAEATGYPVVTAAGAIVMPAMYADGQGTQTVGETYTTWVMNTRNLDLTSYTNYSFNSFAEFMGTQYAAGPAGISKLTGADDAGTDIAAIIKTGGLADTSSGLLKIPEILLTTESSGPLTVSVITDAGTQYDYTTPYVGIDTPIQVRVEPGKGLRGLGYQVEVKNNDGAAFSIVEMNVPLEKTKRRLGDR